MAALREADRLPDNRDWSVSHRPVPLPAPLQQQQQRQQQQQQQFVAQPYYPQSPSLGGEDPSAIGVAHSTEQQQQQQHQQQQQQQQRSRRGSSPWVSSAQHSQTAATAPPESSGRRRGSFSFLRRTTSNNSSSAATATTYMTDSNAPPLPKTLFAQAQNESAQRKASIDSPPKSQKRWRKNSSDSTTNHQIAPSSPNMLRKSSKLAKAQAEAEAQQAREAALARPPPQLPSLNAMAASFDAADRPDSVAIFNQVPRSTVPANFSRPSTTMNNNNHSSSPPSYAIRSASGAVANSSSPAPAPPGLAKGSGEYVVDPPSSERTDSMTNRGRYSYASSVGQVNVSSPRRVRRRKDPTPFNVLVIGAKNSGKTSFISFLRHSLALPAHKQPSGHELESQVGGNRSPFTSHYLETEIEGERVGLTLWDSAGLEKNMVDLQLREMTAFVEAKFEDTFVEEQKVMRSPGVKDTHIHCVFLILDPVRLDTTIAGSTLFHKTGSHAGSLDDDLDLQVMRALWGKTTVIPVISKADTLTVGHMSFLKRAVWECLKGTKLDPLEALELEEEEDDDDQDDAEDLSTEAEDDFPVPKAKKSSHKRVSSLSLAANGNFPDDEMPYIPMSILSPDPYDLPPYVPKHKANSAKPAQIGRKFPWGFADPYDPEHCDFGRLRDSIFKEWRSELRELSRSKWYENWRTSRLKNLPGARMRVKGGVTPVAAVPREGRMGSGGSVIRN